jgi:DNA mismatch repair ATPase MutS
MHDINDQLMETKKYVNYSIASMRRFMQLTGTCSQYSLFHSQTEIHVQNLEKLRDVLSDVEPFVPSFSKLSEIGVLLRCFYELHERPEFGKALQWSFGFEGYMNNLLGICENLEKKQVAFATFMEKGGALNIKDQVYPPHLRETFVKNDCVLDKNMIITGPNAAGKTTFLKTTSLNIIFTQQIGCGYYSQCKMQPYQHIHSYLNIPDTSARDSLFQAESRRCKEILDAVCTVYPEERHFCVFDELYSGTNPMEATKSAYAFLLYLAKFPTVDFVLTTHYMSICKKLKKRKTVRIRNWKMEASCDSLGNISYTYKIVKGVSKIQGAICVLKSMDYPGEIIDTIQAYA